MSHGLQVSENTDRCALVFIDSGAVEGGCCSVWQRVAVCGSAQCVITTVVSKVRVVMLLCRSTCWRVCCSVWQRVAVCGIALGKITMVVLKVCVVMLLRRSTC